MSAAFGSSWSLCIGIIIKTKLIVTFLQCVLFQSSTNNKDIITLIIRNSDCCTLKPNLINVTLSIPPSAELEHRQGT